jgi:hypothetical protein
MKVSQEKIKARRSQFQKEGVKVLAALELNAGVKECRFATVQAKPSSSRIGSRKP